MPSLKKEDIKGARASSKLDVVHALSDKNRVLNRVLNHLKKKNKKY